ncbi:MAG TPA: putative porin [Blastocatellia bacterium]|nr:putative porin [Blastocatellia bacterium]
MKADRLLLAITVFLVLPLCARAQAPDGAKGVGDRAPNKLVDSSGANETKDELERLRSKVDQLVLLIERQQRALAALEQRVGGVQSSPAGTPTPASLKTNDVTNAALPDDASAALAVSAPPAQGPATSAEERLKKVEEQVLKLGPIRFGGDFRFRFDTILRKAAEPPDPPLAHVQNVRMRYRLRLNMDSDISPAVSFHGQLSTGPINNGLTLDQDFTSTVAHQPFFISEAWIDYHPTKSLQLQGGRVQEIFADNSRFLFDDDIRFNGFNEKFSFGKGSNNVELRAGQYWFSNPNVAVITAGSPLAKAGDEVGTIGRSANLFHQGLLVNTQFNEKWSQQIGGDVQVFREPNQIQLASTADGVVFIVQPGLGLVLSGPMTGTGNATTTPGGAIYTAENFHIARLTYRLNHSGFRVGEHAYPISFNLQGARNLGTDANERDAMLAALQIGKTTKRGDMSFLYVFSIKGANSIISQLTDDDLGTGTGVNLRTHYFRWELGLARKVTLQSLVFVQRELRNSGDFQNFFVPLGAFAPRQYRFQEHLVFSF